MLIHSGCFQWLHRHSWCDVSKTIRVVVEEGTGCILDGLGKLIDARDRGVGFLLYKLLLAVHCVFPNRDARLQGLQDIGDGVIDTARDEDQLRRDVRECCLADACAGVDRGHQRWVV